ncbi:c-type cytochrome biogenesis protein CcmI [Pectobacterium carotovorum subsp. carotovorum]|uniref:c-type cytochrome biogenesis protein CcmI n=1 Tax=Pectobacterium carotovorum TaxID=554 RepID=UPI0015DFAAA8|nr:c-type cytochrome biogenesis protein CcmI [Pectobacterium carotovorum]MBA0193492.1 c-type cytochrome biogenesis protein CcmI [Pectobacterium carotovorum]MBA0202119.1 c-type cytochrome biogenesis protein CcmI [Pectobacterium carotovorum]MBB1525409.1 c-type cytochrome biogenesis protein CcmI [Pectobacterium carotovorum subsp. carotovorum]MCA6964529.1 c-type cytochrome biogenesis protein CcmI [Pectobacterium carotovorum]MCH4986962.1 c-type cytochrome biogenesis protein CcmI [Pectobacterium car
MMLLTATIVLSLIALSALLLAPWSSRGEYDRDAINQALYRDRLRELTVDVANEQERAQLVEELQHTLLQDIPSGEKAEQRPLNGWVLLPGVLLLVIVSLGVFWKTSAVNRVQELQQVVALTPDLMKRALDPDAEPLTIEDVARLGLGLRSQLETQPDNPQDWWMLGRIAGLLNNYDMSVQAFAKAFQLDPKNTDLALDYADLLSRSTDPRDSQRGGDMLRELMNSGSTNVRVLSLLAFNAYEAQRYQDAINAWEAMLKLLPQNDTRRAVIERSVAQAKASMSVQATTGK